MPPTPRSAPRKISRKLIGHFDVSNQFNTVALALQVAADLFVVGDGDCGQFGLGEDVVEAPRPLPTSAGEQQVMHSHV